jgi:hypothetical protein
MPMGVLAARAASLESAWRMPFRHWLQQIAELNDVSDRVRL